MASVSSLDKDLRKLRLDKYTPAAANEARAWVEEALGTKLPSSDLLDGLKDGVALCRLVNLGAPPPGIKFKQSTMPFVQMENISHFLRACQAPPFNLHQHDMFLTVDLYEQKDPAQVLQCLGAFSRAAHDANPSRFPEPIGPKNRATGGISPQASGYASPTGLRGRGASINSNSSSAYGSKPSLPPHRTGDITPSGRRSPAKSPTAAGPGSPGPVSSWSRREHEGSTAPAWNIAQYGYMGGASQGNLGISFGGMRQITSAGPHVPSLAEKERRRKVEAERQEEDERQRRAQLEAEEEAARLEEERKWEAETQRLREEERRKAQEEKRRWEEQERQWKLTEEKRRQEEEEAAAKLDEDRRRARGRSDARLRGQFLSQYQAEQAETDRRGTRSGSEELEKQLERARQREEEYERERQTRSSSRPLSEIVPNKPRSRSRHRAASPTPSTPSAVGPNRTQNRYESWTRDDEREYLQTQWDQQQQTSHESTHDPRPEPLCEESVDVESPLPPPQVTSPRPLPDPNVTPKAKSPNTGGHNSTRPLPDPAKYTSPPAPSQNRTDRFLASNQPPKQAQTRQTYARELGATEERDAEDRRRAQSQAQTKAGGWASKSLLEREMEMERQRQQEWEEAQKETAKAVRSGDGVDGIGGGMGGRWDVGQWSGYTGGDSQNRGGQGIGSGRRQIVGPRPLPGSNR
ncbi:calponin [Conoideocrella luteorostrata]|uniref:Calponin n=1 Tax=Conoideocrella luteorostrata TaxID=1105319 RepID=A0AAJ0CJB2_9HYPO|nr:calponin [Conoideocrella luteorostrata]